MKAEKFKVVEFIRQLLIMIDKELSNFPKKDIELKNRIRNNSYDMLEISYEANSISDVKIKQNLINKLLAKIKVIDFLLNLSLDKELISNKKYIKLANKIDDIVKYVSGWYNFLYKNDNSFQNNSQN